MRIAELFANQSWIGPGLYCALMNARNRLRMKRHRIRSAEDGVYAVEDEKDRLFICRRSRHNRSRRGVMAGVDFVARQYGLDRIGGIRGGTFVDCGANIGEFGLWARSRGMRYFAFEPEETEARCCDLNNYAGERRTCRAALWKEAGTLEFHMKPDTADSSLISWGGDALVKKVRAERLDAALSSEDLAGGPNVLKVEAEGAEPEVLAGAAGVLRRFDYVAIDCGPERGPERRHTFVETSALMIEAGFRPMSADFDRVTVLYRNGSRPSAL